jgi:lambda repressor-like predicted transcriptional regulator
MKPDIEEARVREVLRRLIRMSGRSIADVSEAAGYAREYLYQPLRGSQGLKVAHLLRVIEIIGMEPRELWDILALGDASFAPPAAGGGGEPRDVARPNLRYLERRIRETAEQDKERLEEMMRRIAREELGRGGKGED